MSDKLTTLSDETFTAKVIESKIPVVVDFGQDERCAPCRSQTPILEELLTESNGNFSVYKVEVDDQTSLASKYGIRSIPTIICFKEGKETGRLVGLNSKENLLKLLA